MEELSVLELEPHIQRKQIFHLYRTQFLGLLADSLESPDLSAS